MELVPVTVGLASRAWDQQHIDLASAADLVGGATTSGFTAAVAGPAARFIGDWERFTDALGTRSEGQADGLREVIRTYLDTEGVVASRFLLQAYVEERR
ncbi:hypothetical protein EKO23_00615 [Nocardioides guangzhouensis]|uniref:Uncharacterized protein n=1 Tax=Nocardioides guangzhouensis TaxID=2497878 RepID=A0A4Q4ZKU1_9ACTN|nr:hypothetical protein [Nocardioides guangzhouensis]RYP88973.1 hypothetical protein EKO23_00615 [Nocardioides guangzhouensis]